MERRGLKPRAWPAPQKIETEKPKDVPALLKLTHAATERFNDLQDDFLENDSEMETVAREVIGEDFDRIVKAYGFEVDLEDVIAPREW